jgi:hypothetical protein
MTRNTLRCGMFLALLAAFFAGVGKQAIGEEVLFQDAFDKGLSEKWKVAGYTKEDYRLRDGGLEVRVLPTPKAGEIPRINVVLPFVVGDTVIASVKVTLLDEFTEEGEFAGMYLIDETGIEFAAKKQRVNRQLMFSPGRYKFVGKQGEEGDPNKYDVIYSVARPEAGPLRIIVRGGYGHFQVGPDADDKYLNFFHSALREKTEERGFCLTAVGGPNDKEHWVRFDDFKVVRD